MKVVIKAKNINDLVTQLKDIIESIEPKQVPTVEEVVQEMYPTDTTEEQIEFEVDAVAKPIEIEVANVNAPVEVVKPKRAPRTKKTVEPVVETAPVVEVAPVVIPQTIPETQSALPPHLQQAVPKNFYSQSEFMSGFVKILNHLIVSNEITKDYLDQVTKANNLTFIYQISKDAKALLALYEDLVSKGAITRKGDY